jgi:subtilase family serine protease
VSPAGGAGAIAIVDAFDDPTAASDLALFSAQFGLPFNPSNFQIVYANGTRPPTDPTGGWALEAALDIEWAHAMAPNAVLYLVEAASNSYADLLTAVSVASNIVMSAGGGEVSMSWSSAEFPTETSFDAYFTTPSVVYFASAGDSAGPSYPSASPNVVSVGGTTLSMNPSTGAFERETAWERTGGGPSQYEPIPSYQLSLSESSNFRVTPDVALDADPVTGVWVVNSNLVNGVGGPGAWWIVGGTSVSAPTLAGIVNAAGTFASSTSDELTQWYSNVNSTNFFDVTGGVCGPYAGFRAGVGYDFCTGLGSVKGYAGK